MLTLSRKWTFFHCGVITDTQRAQFTTEVHSWCVSRQQTATHITLYYLTEAQHNAFSTTEGTKEYYLNMHTRLRVCVCVCVHVIKPTRVHLHCTEKHSDAVFSADSSRKKRKTEKKKMRKHHKWCFTSSVYVILLLVNISIRSWPESFSRQFS